eukprot:scaffold5570_cov87-Skeletonema_dohrnii-CCMP3373.AAC.8
MKRVSAGRGRRPKQHKLLMGDGRKQYQYTCQCSTDGCTSTAYKGGGVCKRHGATIKRCNSEGCTNEVVKGGVCHRHGAKRKNELRLRSRDAAAAEKEKDAHKSIVKDAQINLIEEECAPDTEQRRIYAARKDAQINLIQEDCVGDMGRRGSFAVVKDVRINLIQEECASGMGQRRHGAKKGNALRKPKVVQSTKREVVQFDCTVLPLKIICDMSRL